MLFSPPNIVDRDVAAAANAATALLGLNVGTITTSTVQESLPNINDETHNNNNDEAQNDDELDGGVLLDEWEDFQFRDNDEEVEEEKSSSSEEEEEVEEEELSSSDEEEEEDDSSGSGRRSKRIRSNEKKATKAAKKAAKIAARQDQHNPDDIKLDGKWSMYHGHSVNEALHRRKGFYVVLFSSGKCKLGYTYTEGQSSSQNLSSRVRQLTVCTDEVVHVRFIETAYLSQRTVQNIENIAKFTGFVCTTLEDGTRKSCYTGHGELYELTEKQIDDLLKALLEYAKKGTFSMTGVPNVTATSVIDGNHSKWIHYTRKTSRKHHSLRACKWTDGDTGSTDKYWEEWKAFVRDPDSTCACIIKAKTTKTK